MLPLLLIPLVLLIYLLYRCCEYHPMITGGGNNTHEMTVSQPWFKYIKEGKKVVEGRLLKSKTAKIKKGDTIIWINGNDKSPTKIVDIVEYDSFRNMLESEGLERVLPGIDNIDDGIKVYNKYFTPEQQAEFKVVALILN